MKDREEDQQPPKQKTSKSAESKPEGGPPRECDFAYERTNSAKVDTPMIVEPDMKDKKNRPSKLKSKSKAEGKTMEQDRSDSRGLSTETSQSLEVPKDPRPLSPTVKFLNDAILPALGKKSISASSGTETSDSADNKSTNSISEKLKKVKDRISPRKSKADPRLAKCVWDISLLQDPSGEEAAPKISDRWIKLTLPVTEDCEYVRWKDSESYTIDEAHENPLPMRSYIYSAAPPKKRGSQMQDFMVIFHIKEWSPKLIEKPAMGCIRLIRDLEGHASLKVNVEFDEAADAELVKTNRQNDVKKMLENAVLNTCAEETKRSL